MWRQMNIHAKNDVSFKKKTETPRHFIFFFRRLPLFGHPKNWFLSATDFFRAQVKVRNAKIVMKPKLESVNPFYERPIGNEKYMGLDLKMLGEWWLKVIIIPIKWPLNGYNCLKMLG